MYFKINTETELITLKKLASFGSASLVFLIITIAADPLLQPITYIFINSLFFYLNYLPWVSFLTLIRLTLRETFAISSQFVQCKYLFLFFSFYILA